MNCGLLFGTGDPIHTGIARAMGGDGRTGNITLLTRSRTTRLPGASARARVATTGKPFWLVCPGLGHFCVLIFAEYYLAQRPPSRRSICLRTGRKVRCHWHALRTRACHPGRADGANESTSAQSLALTGFSYVRLYLSAALGGSPSL